MFKKYVSAIFICLLLVLMSTSEANAIESIIREAESANSITTPFVIQSDPLASGGQYIVNPAVGGASNTNPPTTGIAKYNITITEGGTYKLFLRVLCTVAGEDDDSCYVRINGATPSITPGGNDGWTNCNNIDGGVAAAATTVWFWAQVREYGTTYPGTVITFDIPKGNTTIEIAWRENGLKIDTLVLTNDPAASTTNLPLPISSKPYPANNARDVSLNTKLWWKPGVFAETFNVFIGTDINDVLNATAGEHDDVVLFQALDANNLTPGMLEYGKDYYWRVDDIGTTTNKGSVWKFTSEPKGRPLAASNILGVESNSPIEVYDYQDPNSTYNGKGLDDVNGTHSNENTATNSTMWVGMGDGPGDVWLQYELDQVYKLYQLQIWNYNEPEPSLGFGAKDVNVLYSIDNITWKALDEIQVLPMATGETTYKTDIFVDMNGAIAKYVKLSFLSSHTEDMYIGGISEIRFLVIPTRASKPSPANNATNVSLNSVISWESGRDAAVHKIYIGPDKDSVMNGTPVETTVPNYTMALGLSKTYYWKVDEVNDAEEYTTWESPVWQFSTQQYVVVDGFEVGYGNDATQNAVFLTWKDAAELNDSSNGSYMGRKSEPYLQTINHSGGHSAPMQYDNTSYNYSEVKAETSKLAIGPDWSLGNPGIMEIWFRADANDVNEPVTDKLYAAFNGGSRIYYDGDASDIRKSSWSKFEVPLSGVSLTNVTSVTIGVEKIGATGGMGTIYIDDIRLGVFVAEVNPGTENLIARYEMEDNVKDTSGSGFDGETFGIENGGLTYEVGKYGKALVFDGNDDYVTLPIGETIGTLSSCTISTWVNWAGGAIWQRVFDFGNDTNVYMYLSPQNNATSVRFAITTGSNGNEDGVNSSSGLPVGYWEHVAVVIDAENAAIKLYRNGSLAASNSTNVDTFPTSLGTTTNNYLGKSQWPDPAFKGKIDDFRIYDRALTDGEVKYLFKN